jgi:Caspase domain/NACHT domain
MTTAGFPSGFALVVGIAEYDALQPLPEAVRHDARDVYDTLVSPAHCGYDSAHVRLLLDGEATRDAVVDGLQWLAQRAGEDATVVVYFSGHGGRVAADAEDNFLCPANFDPEEVSTGLNNEALAHSLRLIRAARLLLILDCCHAGGTRRTKAGEPAVVLAKPTADYFERLNRGTGRVVMASSRATEKSVIRAGMRNSIFTQYLLEGLRGRAETFDGAIGFFDLFEYTRRKVTAVERRQHPVLHAEGVESNFPVALHLGGRGDGDPIEAARILQRLNGVSREQFEEIVFGSGADPEALPANARQSDRAAALVQWAQRTADLAVIDELADRVADAHRAGEELREWGRRHVSRLLPRLYRACVARRLLREEPDATALEQYLGDFAADMKRRNGGNLILVPQNVGDLPRSTYTGAQYEPKIEPGSVIKQVRHVLRLLSGISSGGDNATAQLAALNRPTRIVRDAVATLDAVREPLILLGDPGSGKSMTLREVGRQIALREIGRRSSRVVVYVPLGRYQSLRDDDHPGDVLELIGDSIPAEHSRIRDMLPLLIAQKRLVVLFDGMDEMERKRYAERIRALSEFAARNVGWIKTLFACRINDFLPEFAHRQMVLLPFDRDQIAEYARNTMTFPIDIDGRRYALKSFLNHLLEEETLGESASNPLMLFLLVHYIRQRHAWPKRRAEVFRYYVESVYDGYRRTLPPSQKHDTVLADLARFAFEITRKHAGTIGTRQQFADAVGSRHAAFAMSHGLRCGLLLPVPGEEHSVRFSHHRLQEFFTGWFLAQTGKEVDWRALLDTPRWQETLLYLMSFATRQEALQTLGESLEVEEPSEEAQKRRQPLMDAAVEMRFADRVVLAAQIARDSSVESARLPQPFVDAFMNAVEILCKFGRPTSQVKMLWAWKSAAALLPIAYVRPQLESALLWVREQAVVLVTSSRGIREIEADLRFHIAAAVASGELFSRIGVYYRAARRQAAVRWVWLGALWTAFVYAGLLAVAGGVGWIALQQRLVTTSMGIAAFAALSIIAIAIVGRATQTASIQFVPYAVLLPAAILYFAKSANRPYAGVLRLLAAISLTALACMTVLFAAYVTFALAAGTLRRKRGLSGGWVASSNAMSVHKAIFLLPFAGAVLVGFLALLDALGEWFNHRLVGLTKVLRGIFFAVILVAFVSGALSVVGALFAKIREILRGEIPLWGSLKDLAKNVFFFVAAVFLLFVVIGLAVLIIDRGSPLLPFIVLGALCLYCTVVTVVFCIRSVRRRSLRRGTFTPQEFRFAIIQSDAKIQEQWLANVSRAQMQISSAEYLQLLFDVEPHIKKEPAASAYWRLRSEVEQVIRQSQLEDEAIAQDG